ncbi:ABC transporter ATP-binding protein [Algicola sagamiensis]|uniref:ABC transporter ATP-binding protein n=1 Tax=Algicola sagamiensis TaxID=163869 RepID=UPI001FE157D5|nr:ATP-binding cassette domain-containing protein [Algicola sagamiensis]
MDTQQFTHPIADVPHTSFKAHQQQDSLIRNKSCIYQLKQVGVSIGEKEILSPVNLSLQPGRVYGLVGHNGSGKSTLLKVLSRTIAPTQGEVSLKGQAIETWKSRAFSQQVAYLPQYLPSANGLTARELLSMSRYAWHGMLGRKKASDKQAIDHAIALTGVADLLERQVDTLSGGERQRVWLTTLVAQQSGCLLLDEPTSALDVGHQLEVLQLIQTLGHDHGKCIVIIMHDINMAARYCDEIIALREGKMLLQAAPSEVMQPDVLQKIYGINMAVMHPEDHPPISFAKKL